MLAPETNNQLMDTKTRSIETQTQNKQAEPSAGQPLWFHVYGKHNPEEKMLINRDSVTQYGTPLACSAA